MKDNKEMLQTELNNHNRLYNYIKDKADDKVLRMFTLFNLASKLEYKTVEVGDLELVFSIKDLQTKIIDFIMRSLRRKQD